MLSSDQLRSAALLLLLAGLGPGCGSGSGTGTSGAGGAGGHGGAQGTGGGMTQAEACLDAIDNDGDGTIDCADTDCQSGTTCVDAPVSGWDGVIVQRVPYPAAAPPSPCPDGKAPSVYYAGPADAACTPCDCKLSGAVCTAPEMTCTSGGLCIGFMSITVNSTDTSCGQTSPPVSGVSCHLTKGATLKSPGTCAVSGGALVKQELWTEEVRVCAAAGGGCAAGQACAPKPPPGFEPRVCMTQPGSAACPGGWSDLDLPVFEGGTDTRACSACGCDTSAVSCAGGKYTLHAGMGCMPGATVTIDSTTCMALTPLMLMPPDFWFSYAPELATGTGEKCSTTQPSGEVTTSGPHRICCKASAP